LWQQIVARMSGLSELRQRHALPTGQSRVDRGPEAAMFRRELWRAGVGFKQEDRDGEDDQGGGEQDDAAAHMKCV
ncbi:hypothetical protein, partial [Bradyrhizobium genosp. SA-3]|uniref:hypothetical protein n=1 Tax=Bradyrhizobium genosp. SA-3 TaxID=508868 RepID=UPI001ABF174B